MTFNTILAFALGIAWVLGLWLVIILSSLLVWQAVGRWAERLVERRTRTEDRLLTRVPSE
jgi:uncharacterized protein (DUF58 family)